MEEEFNRLELSHFAIRRNAVPGRRRKELTKDWLTDAKVGADKAETLESFVLSLPPNLLAGNYSLPTSHTQPSLRRNFSTPELTANLPSAQFN